jgi:hypothetical protein
MKGDRYMQKKIAEEWAKGLRLSQVCHLRAAALNKKRNKKIGIPVVVLSTIVGTSIFATLENNPEIWIKAIVGVMSITAAVLSALQSFLKHAETADRHAVAATKYGELRRKIEGIMPQLPMDKNEWKQFEGRFRKSWRGIDSTVPTYSQVIHDAALEHINKRNLSYEYS